MDFDTVFRETRSGRNVRQIIVLPNPDVSEPDTVSEDELDHTFQQSNSSSDDEVIEEDDASTDARRKSCIWRRRPFNPKTEPFIASDEEIPSVLKPIEYFRMYFTPQLLSHISFETNRKATQSLYSNLVTSVAEIEVLIGMLITMGIYEMPRYRMYWANQTRMDTLANCMSHNRFETLLRFLHFNDNDKVVMDRNHLDYDRFYKIRPLIESIRKTCLEETPGELQSVIARCRKNGFVHDFWLSEGMAPNVENPVGFFTADFVMKVCETLPNYKGYKWFDNREVILASTYKCVDPVTPVRRWDKRNANLLTFLVHKLIDHKCRKWHRRVFFWAIHVSLTNSWIKYKADCMKNGIEPRNMMDLMAFMLSVSDSLIKLEKTYVTRKCGRRPSEPPAEEEAGPSKTVRRTREPEDITRTDQTGHWPEMMTTKKRCRVCHRTCQVRCMKCDIHLSKIAVIVTGEFGTMPCEVDKIHRNMYVDDFVLTCDNEQLMKMLIGGTFS
ncbi:PiggyBac transposable element-derived protein 2 [Trichinella sp. T6]|nr:PiggyBac transposable element-derived protein 2 [Trichinella sp. T6]